MFKVLSHTDLQFKVYVCFLHIFVDYPEVLSKLEEEFYEIKFRGVISYLRFFFFKSNFSTIKPMLLIA